MKKTTTIKKLELHRSTVRVLTADNLLNVVAGGKEPTTQTDRAGECPRVMRDPDRG